MIGIKSYTITEVKPSPKRRRRTVPFRLLSAVYCTQWAYKMNLVKYPVMALQAGISSSLYLCLLSTVYISFGKLIWHPQRTCIVFSVLIGSCGTRWRGIKVALALLTVGRNVLSLVVFHFLFKQKESYRHFIKFQMIYLASQTIFCYPVPSLEAQFRSQGFNRAAWFICG